MKKVLKWLFSRKIVVCWLCLATVLDVLFTLWVFSLFSQDVINEFKAAEKNPILRYFFGIYGVQFTLLVILPAVMTLMIALIYRFWEFRVAKYYGYFLFIVRVGLMVNNIAVVVLLVKNGMVK